MPRLTDIVVTEVSLVTKAATKRKFLLFKSSGEDQMEGKFEVLQKAIEELGTNVKSLLEKRGTTVDMPKSEDTESVVKALGGFTGAIEKAFNSADESVKSAVAKAESLEKQVTELTAERDKLKAQIDESESHVSEEVMGLVEEVQKAIPSVEDLKSLIEESMARVVGFTTK